MTDNLATKLAHFQLDGDNSTLLREVGQLLEPELDRVLENFYKRANAVPETAAFFTGPDRITLARNAQKIHWTRLLSADFGADYRASVDRIGRTHARIDLPLDTYMSAYALATSDLLTALIRRLPRRQRSKLPAMLGVLTRAFALDIERVVETTFRIHAEEQTIAFEQLNTAIEKLAQGDLTYEIPGPDCSDYPARYDDVRVKLNNATAGLCDTTKTVNGTLGNLVKIIAEVSSAANDLSQRTANQAASLEETAAAVHELTENVTSSARNTSEANSVAGEAAQTAMEGANTVEEVRVLAGNASDAARQISDLVSTSSREVNNGVDLIDMAARNLQGIVGSFDKVSTLSSAIAAASSEQSTALSEVNSAISQMDSVTQQNAAMVEQTTAAASMMRQSATEVETALQRLRTTPEASTAPQQARAKVA